MNSNEEVTTANTSSAEEIDKEVVLAAVKENGYALLYASEGMKNDKEVVLAAVKQNGNALQYASEGMKNVKEVVLAAVNKMPTHWSMRLRG